MSRHTPFHSKYTRTPTGPDPSIVHGPDSGLIQGPQNGIAQGPNPGLVQGPELDNILWVFV